MPCANWRDTTRTIPTLPRSTPKASWTCTLESLDIWWRAHRGYGGIDWHAPGGIETESQHPGASHFYIHAVEASPNPEVALASARVLETIVPSAGHLLHMPSHLYVRLGNYFEAVKANEAAASADRAFLRATGMRNSGYGQTYYCRNLEFLCIAASMLGKFPKEKGCG
jgi:hypothetical protein